MLWKLVFEEFGTNIQHIYVVYNILAYTLSKFPYTSVDKYKPITSKYQFLPNKLFTIGREEKNEDCFLIIILIVQRD